MIKYIAIIFINLFVFVCGLSAVEIGFRLKYGGSANLAPTGITLQFWPYVMTGQVPNFHYRHWFDQIRSKPIDVDISTNNAGFPNGFDFDIAQRYQKQPDERVVLLTGGSTAFGVGATSNSNITHEVLARLLNSAQHDVHYTVVNLANGGWIAEQEAIALDLWGRLFNPDWVLTLDGVNDSLVGCAMSQGTANPVYFQAIRTLVMGYLAQPSGAVFYRGYWENELIKHSVAYRLLTGKQYIPPPSNIDNNFSDSMLQITTETRLSEIRRQVAFYILTEEAILDRFSGAKFLMTTQPTAQDFAFFFGDYAHDTENSKTSQSAAEQFASQLDQWLDLFHPAELKCGGDTRAVGISNRYILGMSATRLAETIERYRQTGRRDVEYYNTGLLYPWDKDQRQAFFIDNYHLNDSGQERLAQFYTHRILERDFPDKDWSGIRPANLSMQ